MTRHPCGALPLSTFSVLLHYCHHHQAWFATVERWLQEDDDPYVVGTTRCEFGPFDRLTEVQQWVAESLQTALELPGLPWAY